MTVELHCIFLKSGGQCLRMPLKGQDKFFHKYHKFLIAWSKFWCLIAKSKTVSKLLSYRYQKDKCGTWEVKIKPAPLQEKQT